MTTTMEYKTLNLVNKNINDSFSVEHLTIEQLIDLIIDSKDNNLIELRSRQELVRRGKDNIATRISIKKTCKKAINYLESLLNKIALENNDKESAKAYKSKFLNSISILDKLQLEWQKYDLSIIH